jgi:hypothetical protein
MKDEKLGGDSGLLFAVSGFLAEGGHEAFDAFAVGFEEAAEFFHRWQGDEVAGDEELLVHAGGGEFDGGSVAVAAQEDADGRVVALFHALAFHQLR